MTNYFRDLNDQLAERGTRFRNYYVTPRCSPTRMSLLTGLYTQQVATVPGDPLPPLRYDNNVTIPEVLSAAGYRTYMAGKWHIGTLPQQVPRSRGFDHAFGFGPQAAGAEASKWDKSKYGFVSKGNAIPAHVYGDGPRDFYQATAIGDYALDYLNYHYAQKDNAPFFMYLPFNAPHFPIQVDSALAEAVPAGGQSYLAMYTSGWEQIRSQRYARMQARGVIDSSFGLSPTEPFLGNPGPNAMNPPVQQIPAWASLGNDQKADLTRKMALYAACIQAVDATVGRVVARLKAEGQFENTLIFVQSDNGGNYEGGVVGTAYGSPAPLTGQMLLNMGQPSQQSGGAQNGGDHVQVGGGWANVQNTPFRFFKHYTHGGGVRSPLIVSWPAKTMAPGAWTNQVADVIDLAPTIIAAAQATHPTQFGGHAVLPLEGTPLLDVLADPKTTSARKLGFEHETNRAWIDGNFKMVVRHEDGDIVELYDLSTDPSELNDLAKAEPARVMQMVKAWNAWATRVGVPADRQLKLP